VTDQTHDPMFGTLQERPPRRHTEQQVSPSWSPTAWRGRGTSTQPGIAFVTGANRGLGRNTALDLAHPPHERGDAARNRALLVDAARRLIAARGPDTVTMDEIAAAAGVGKGTLFRRFGSRAGLMIVLLDEDEQASSRPSCSVRRRWDPARRRWNGCWPTVARG
jgi:hypothetical protein